MDSSFDVFDKNRISSTEVVRQLQSLGVQPGVVLLVHASFGAIGPLDGGPDAFIDALIEVVGAGGTIVMPSWTDDDDDVFDSKATPTDDHLGIVSDTFWRRTDVVRGTHPFAVAARGPKAAWISAAPFVLPPHAPDSGVARVHDLDGWVLLAGVDHDANTTIHLAELMAGAPYRQQYYVTVLEEGRPKRIDYGENDCCCRNFKLVGRWLRERGLERDGPLGHGHAILARSRDIVATVVDELRDDLCRFLCPRGTCEDCDESWQSVVTSTD